MDPVTALVTLQRWLPVLAGSTLAVCGAATLRLEDVRDRSCSWDPLWCRGTCAQCGLAACGAGAAPGVVGQWGWLVPALQLVEG